MRKFYLMNRFLFKDFCHSFFLIYNDHWISNSLLCVRHQAQTNFKGFVDEFHFLAVQTANSIM